MRRVSEFRERCLSIRQCVMLVPVDLFDSRPRGFHETNSGSVLVLPAEGEAGGARIFKLVEGRTVAGEFPRPGGAPQRFGLRQPSGAFGRNSD